VEWGYFTGRVPLAKNEIAGDEDSFEESWENFTDVDLGCVTSEDQERGPAVSERSRLYGLALE
jgi:hypothetical protein